MSKQQLSRRRFLRTSTAGAALLGLPAATYRAALGYDGQSPADRIRIACVGVGIQGRGNLGQHAKGKSVVAVCDVDKDRAATAAAALEKGGGKAELVTGDYRRVLDRKDVDAVIVSTPDHWHALVTIDACRAGKDVYCEKPLTLFVAEGRAMVDAARKHNRVVQTGSHQRSSPEVLQACELVRNGTIGKVHTVKVGLPGPNWVDRAKGPAPDSDPPAGLDWDRWLGPAPERRYNEKRAHYLFRFFWDYSGGQQTNWGAHFLDIAQWGLGMDDSGPVSVEGTATFNKDKWFETPETARQTYTYADGTKLLCSLGGGGYPGGTTFEGERGSISASSGKITASDPEILKADRSKVKLYASADHHKDWLECIKTRKRPICDVEVGHRSATVCHLGNIALRTGRKIAWDPAGEQILGDAEANAMLTRPYRAPWKLV